ncbi:malonate decarboxylase subunit delta [Geomicrobium sp. JSM 1781026]|uniref:malonate decarboxylase subunit delta n=1 Tax=Geomicrobium sp. JSM 1781026 TaxID=3344580 RepID=UPI0035BF6D33
MEEYQYTYESTQTIEKRVHVGVVGSGDAEILMEPANTSSVTVKTNVEGFKNLWEDVLQRFMEEADVCAQIEIHDFGATPGVIRLRLQQALEEAKS